MLSEVQSLIGQDCKIVEIGALDGLSYADILDLAPRRGENSIITRLSNGRSVVVSGNWLRHRIGELCASRGHSVADLTVIGSTGIHDVHDIGPYVIEAQNTVEKTMETLFIAGQKIGEILPLKEQMDNPYIVPDGEVIRAQAGSGDSSALHAACRQTKSCDFIILNSMGYSEQDRVEVAAHSGKPVILVRRIVARILTRAMQDSPLASQVSDLSAGSSISSRLSQLTNRERQVFELVIEGLSNKEIARFLDISHRTVEIHRGRMMSKMGVSTAVQLMRMMVQHAYKPRLSS